jgi:hypothetical protein
MTEELKIPPKKKKIYEAELNRLSGKTGKLKPEDVVKAASDPKSPLHDAFEWNDRKAGFMWRVHQARLLMGSLTMVVLVENRKLHVPIFVHDPSSKESQYIKTSKLKRDEENTRDLILEEFARAAGHLKRARDLAAVLRYDGDIDELLESLMSLEKEIRQDA